MTTVPLTDVEDVELTLIARDVSDLLRAMLGPKGHPDAGSLIFPTMPLMGLVTEESFHYLSNAPQQSSLQPLPTLLFSRFGRAVTKTRARIKLFDDTDGGADGLVEILELAHSRSVEWFREPHRGPIRSLIRRFQPDLGIFFVGENLIASTHAVLPAMGITLNELKDFSSNDMERLVERSFAFSSEVGVYLGQLATFLHQLGKRVELQPEAPDIRDLRVSHNDFIGANVYRLALYSFRPNEARFVGAVIMALAHINAALYVLPRLLGVKSNLLLRFQLLTAYHAGKTLEASIPQILPPISEAERTVLRSRQVRNLCAHFGLRGAAQTAMAAEDPFGAALQSLISVSRSEVEAVVNQWLNTVSDLLTARLSKSSLAPCRAWLGSHS